MIYKVSADITLAVRRRTNIEIQVSQFKIIYKKKSIPDNWSSFWVQDIANKNSAADEGGQNADFV